MFKITNRALLPVNVARTADKNMCPPFFTYFFKKSTFLTSNYFYIFFMLALLIPFSLNATETEEKRLEEKRKIELDITHHQINIQRLDQGLESQKEGVEETLLQEKGILAEIEDIELRLIKTTKKLKELKKRMAEQQHLIEVKTTALQQVKKKRGRVQLHLQKRMAAYYKLGKIDFINITFSTQTLPELLKFHDSFQNVIKYDQGVITNYRSTIAELESATEALTLEKGLLEEFIYQANEENRIITETKEKKGKFLARIKNQSELHKQAIKELKKAQDNLTESLQVLKKKEELFDQGFFLNKGKHIAPMNGSITSLFNQERINKFGIKRKTPGLSFVAPDGTQIRAIFNGKVLYAGYLRGYGNTVILDHGYQYYTIISRIERILVSKNNIVKSGDIIGIMGETATLMDDGLYFEIRHKESSLDPLKWLDIGLLTFKLAMQPQSSPKTIKKTDKQVTSH